MLHVGFVVDTVALGQVFPKAVFNVCMLVAVLLKVSVSCHVYNHI